MNSVNMQRLLQDIPFSYTLIKIQYIFTLAFPLFNYRLPCKFWLPTQIQQAANDIAEYIRLAWVGKLH